MKLFKQRQERRESRTRMAALGYIVSADDWIYASEIRETLGISAGSLYPALAELEHRGMIESEWTSETDWSTNDSDEDRRRRRVYRARIWR